VLLAQEGNRVVRLKGGDPLVFGRADEEIRAAERAGIAFSIVSGISAAQGAAAALGVSLTQRGVARRVQFLTAHDETGGLPQGMDWASIADPGVTTCVYMGRRNLRAFLDRAQSAGLDPDTPARFVLSATSPNQHVLSGSVAQMAALADACQHGGPGLMMLGQVFGQADMVQSTTVRLAAE
jgi:uroporphyrin-III C-methyltransferase/precorrin-2 dehydrogenase/sirohydrochlorin ferrochelatase